MRAQNLIFLTLTLLLAAACGGESADEDAGGGAAPTEALTAKTGHYENVTLDGRIQYTYTIDLPAAYELHPTASLPRWVVKGTKSKVKPHVRVSGDEPLDLEAAVAKAAKGVLGARDVIFKHESDTTIVVVGRDPSGEWTQIDAWGKGKGLVPHCWIEFYKVAEDAPVIDWAKRVAMSLRQVGDPTRVP